MKTVDRIVEVTCWRESPWECDWTETEAMIGVSLPDDYKELYKRFGSGYFSSYIYLRPDRGQESLRSWWLAEKLEYERDQIGMARLFDPYAPYGVFKGNGLINWGGSVTEDNFFWLADAGADPDSWPILAKISMGDDQWFRYDMKASEFLYRVLTDVSFEPFGITDPEWPRTFERFDFSSRESPTD